MRILLCLVLLPFPIPSNAFAGPTAADSVAAPVPAAMARAPADTARARALYIVSLRHGEEIVAARAEYTGLDYVRIIHPDGQVSSIAAYRIRSIKDSEGTDWTGRVLDQRKAVGSAEGIPHLSTQQDFVLRGRPLAEAKGFAISQVGFLGRATDGPFHFDSKTLLTVDLGAMRNVSRRVALGGNLYVAGDDDHVHFGPKVRVRYWITRDLSADLAPGLVWWGGTADDLEFPAWVGETSVNIDDILILTAEVESVRVRSNGSEKQETSLFLGGKIGGEGGLIGIAAGMFVLVMFAAGAGGRL